MTRDEKAAEMHRALIDAAPPCDITITLIPPAVAAILVEHPGWGLEHAMQEARERTRDAALMVARKADPEVWTWPGSAAYLAADAAGLAAATGEPVETFLPKAP